MKAEYFEQKAKGATAKQAFDNAVAEAAYNYGHAGYTGTIAEKDSFEIIKKPEGIDLREFIESDEVQNSELVNDKWGPAACIGLGNGEYVFLGWASS